MPRQRPVHQPEVVSLRLLQVVSRHGVRECPHEAELLAKLIDRRVPANLTSVDGALEEPVEQILELIGEELLLVLDHLHDRTLLRERAGQVALRGVTSDHVLRPSSCRHNLKQNLPREGRCVREVHVRSQELNLDARACRDDRSGANLLASDGAASVIRRAGLRGIRKPANIVRTSGDLSLNDHARLDLPASDLRLKHGQNLTRWLHASEESRISTLLIRVGVDFRMDDLLGRNRRELLPDRPA